MATQISIPAREANETSISKGTPYISIRLNRRPELPSSLTRGPLLFCQYALPLCQRVTRPCAFCGSVAKCHGDGQGTEEA